MSGLESVAGNARSSPHVLVADVDAPVLAGDDRHHLERVLRLRSGDLLTVGDGAGRWRPCRFGELVEPVGDVVEVAAPSPELAVGFALLKGGRSETVVQKLTELGVDRIVPFVAERSVVRWDGAKTARLLERRRRVVREAVMQCRRLWLPEVEPVRAFGDLDLGGTALAVPEGRTLAAGENFVLVGPEGGWADAELAAVDRQVCLGPHIMRAETAAIAAAALLGARRGGHLPAAGTVSGG
ncbi:MAG: 16S rRNA (uracil(1498)-N(3))-methyltransferase [Acidimicrobiaceae bacterium]|nr:16S rRNA (uracil(1498)-N(3))-methyltransferase [Acidimicrobiaceae bacterium]MYE75275.1 16S rRNA (uracil(1498)-N(3))-methyltransferase [Acidimicrobiaceae bacterium]MYJ41659.1 16S rRNA (uracil(1498)-N(3))-methyltransferase [Acidimicrobiaceae bacterium]